MQDIFEKIVQIFAGNTMLNYIADTCMTVSVVIVFLLLVRPLMKRLPRIGMYVLWFMVVVRLLCPVTINGIYRMLPSRVEQSVAEANQNLTVAGLADRIEQTTRVEYAGQKNSYRLPAESSVDQAAKSGTVKETEQSVTSVKPTGAEQKNTTQKQWFPEWTEAEIILLVWGAGVFICWLYMLVSLLVTRFRYADARHLQDNIYTHPLLDGSFVAGIFSPRIYVPEDLSEADRVYILCHERVHIRRRDYLIKPFVFAVFSLLWFNPLLWAAYHFMMKDMEISCDEAVMRTLGSEAKARYSYLLLSMTGGRGNFLGQNPAFSAGTLRERIANVMKYKRPTAFVTALAMAAVVLCSCGIASTPQKTEKNVAAQAKKIYVEQTLSCFATSVYGGGNVVDYDLPKMDLEGHLVDLPTVYQFLDNEKYSIEKVKMTGGSWRGEEISWKDAYEKLFAENKDVMVLAEYQYAGDGYLYLTVWECSMSMVKYQSDREKYGDSFYIKDIHFVKVDEAAGTVTEIPVPKESEQAVLQKQYGEDIPDDIDSRGIAVESIRVLGNGNLYISNNGNICGIYSQTTGEKLAEGSANAYCFTGVVPGDDFYCQGIADPQTGQVEIEIYDEGGELINKLSTGVETTAAKIEAAGNYQGAALGVKGSTILLATSEGIFEAAPEDKQFTKVVDTEKDNLYYLSEDCEIEPNSLYKGGEGEYYLVLYKETTSGGGNEDHYLCCYSEKG